MIDKPNNENDIDLTPKKITDRPITDTVLRKAIYKSFEGKCFYTGRNVSYNDMHIDHVVPKAKGGKDNIFNYVLACPDINYAKGHRYNPAIAKRILDTVKLIYAPLVIKNIKKIELGLLDDQIFDPSLYWSGSQDGNLLENAFNEKLKEDPFFDDQTNNGIVNSLKKIEDLFLQKLTLELEKTIEIFRKKMLSELDSSKKEIIDGFNRNAIKLLDKRLDQIEKNLMDYLIDYLSDIKNDAFSNSEFSKKQPNDGRKKKDSISFSREMFESKFEDVFTSEGDESDKSESEFFQRFSEIDYVPTIDDNNYHLEKYRLATNKFQDKFINVDILEALGKLEREKLATFVNNLKNRKFSFYHIADFLNKDLRFNINASGKKWTALDIIYIDLHKNKMLSD